MYLLNIVYDICVRCNKCEICLIIIDEYNNRVKIVNEKID